MDKADLHRVIDELPEDRQEEALRLLEDLRDRREYTAENAPLDDEPLSEEDWAAIERSRQDEAAGRITSHEDLKRELYGM